MIDKQKLRENYEKACNQYLKAFCEKHEYEYDTDAWVADEVGGIICVSDYYIDMETIVSDINMDAPVDEFTKWYDYNLRASKFGRTVNFKSWLKGCPVVSNEILDKVDELNEKIRTFENEIQQIKNNF